MAEERKEQEEALRVLADFQPRIIGNTETLIDELKGIRKEDTADLLKSVTDAVNWEVGVLNGTLSLINEESEKLNKDEINQAISALSEALKSQEDIKIAETLENQLLPVLRKIQKAL